MQKTVPASVPNIKPLTFYSGLTTCKKPGLGRARLTYLPHTLGVAPRVERYFGALDSLDADAVAEFFAADATVRLPGLPPIIGRSAIRRTLVEISVALDELRHVPVQLWAAGNLSVFEADMTLTPAGRGKFVFPVTHVLRWLEGSILEARVSVYLESRMAVAMLAFAQRGKRPPQGGGLAHNEKPGWATQTGLCRT